MVAVFLIAVIQVLHNQTREKGGVLFAEDINKMPFMSVFAYRYLPTIIAVSLSIVWGWIDVDAKRLEPYFQLSKPEGATAADSILLDYPFDLLPIAPFKAAKRRSVRVLMYVHSCSLIVQALGCCLLWYSDHDSILGNHAPAERYIRDRKHYALTANRNATIEAAPRSASG